MRQTDTQKNWNEYFDNPKRTPSNIHWGLVFFMLLCIFTAIIYAAYNKDEPAAQNTAMDIGEALNLSESNRTGSIMNESLETIFDIFHNIVSKSLDELSQDAVTIENINLSNEYDEYIRICLKKLRYYIAYKETLDSKYLEQYNACKPLPALTAAFDEVGIAYEYDGYTLHYTYKQDKK